LQAYLSVISVTKSLQKRCDSDAVKKIDLPNRSCPVRERAGDPLPELVLHHSGAGRIGRLINRQPRP
jgi:hypothetical protein